MKSVQIRSSPIISHEPISVTKDTSNPETPLSTIEKKCNAYKHIQAEPHSLVPSRPLSLGRLGRSGPIEGPATLPGPGADAS